MSEYPVGSRLIFLVLITMLCLEGFFYIFYKLSQNSLPFNIETSNYHVAKDEEDPYPVNCRRNQDHETVILIWKWPFGHHFNLGSCSKLFNIIGCRLTYDQDEYDKVHGVMFHHRDIYNNLSELLRMRRPPLQKWVWMNMESPGNCQRQAQLDGVFNLTANYRRDSDVWVPYGKIREAHEKDKTFTIPPKDKLVCWIVNNWDTRFKRVQYFNELKKHVPIQTYGGAFERPISPEEYNGILSSCKFYLSFENSIHKDYLTEKLFNPMRVGTVPVVLGPPRENYEEFIPADSFIHVDDFKSAQELAEHLKFLDQNQEAYERFFTWRQHFTAKVSYFGLEHACRICDHIKRHTGYRVVKNLSNWYWG